MNSALFVNIARFVLLLAAQILIFSNMNFLGYINPYPYILFIILYPVNGNKYALLLSSFFLGIIMTLWMIGVKLYHVAAHIPYKREITDQPMFYIALVAIIVGSQMFLAGFIAELVGRNAPERNQYLIEKEII